MRETQWSIRELKKSNLKIHVYPDPILCEKCKEVADFNDDIRQLAQDMLQIMYQQHGVGLAAPQVGVPLRMFVMDCKYVIDKDIYIKESSPYVMVNPYFKERHDFTLSKEGCLSFPGMTAEISRAETIDMVYWTQYGEKKIFNRHGDDNKLETTCVQHEMDHLDGKLFIDHLKRPERRRIEKVMKKLAKKKV